MRTTLLAVLSLLLTVPGTAVAMQQSEPGRIESMSEAEREAVVQDMLDTLLDQFSELREAERQSEEDRELGYWRHTIAGFQVLVHLDLRSDERALHDRVLLHLQADLDEIVHLVPAPALAALRKTTIWVELQGAKNEGMSGRGMCCHWSEDWVVAHGMPAEKAGGVEIVNAQDYIDWRRTQPYMMLHELAHAYHRMLGGRTPEIVEAFEHARDEGLYEQIDRNTLPLGDQTEAYAITNHHEYFAEVSEAYLALNDFAPYTRRQLVDHDPTGARMAEAIWNLSADEIARRMTETGLVDPP